MSRPEYQAPPEIVRPDISRVPSVSHEGKIPSTMVMWRPKSTQASTSCSLLTSVNYTYNLHLSSTRNQEIQSQMTLRALELLNLPEGDSPFLLDIGCGSGLSGEILDEHGYNWVGVDIAPSMLGKVFLILISS